MATRQDADRGYSRLLAVLGQGLSENRTAQKKWSLEGEVQRLVKLYQAYSDPRRHFLLWIFRHK